MSTQYKYTITTKKGVNVSTIDTDMQRATSKAQYPFFPTRSVTAVDQRPLNNRSTDYYLTYNESVTLSKDPDILAVEPLLKAGEITGSIDLISSESKNTLTLVSGSGIVLLTTSSIEEGNFVIGRGYFSSSVAGEPWYPGILTKSLNTNNILNSLKNSDGVIDMANVMYSNYISESRVNFRTSSYSIDGRGVDIIISDPGFTEDHSEFLDKYGNTRLQKIDWNTHLGLTQDETGFDSSDPNKWYSSGFHGTYMGSQCFGNIMGVARGATPYFIKTNLVLTNDDVEGGVNQSGFGTYTLNAFNLARLFHESKSIDPSTGYKRPTVLVQSIGYNYSLESAATGSYFISPSQLATMSFAGTEYTASGPDQYFGSFNLGNYFRTPLRDKGVLDNNGKVNAHREDWNAIMEECTDAGVIVCRSAGNLQEIYFASGSVDDPDFDPNNDGWYNPVHWDNYYSFDIDIGSENLGYYPAGYKFYFSRGQSPISNKMFACGAAEDSGFWLGNNYVEGGLKGIPVASYTAKGPRVDVYATTGIAAWSGFSLSSGESAYWVSDLAYRPRFGSNPPNLKKRFYRGFGTSYASPIVGGMAALYLQVNPGADATEIRKWFRSNAGKMMPGINSDPTRYTSQSLYSKSASVIQEGDNGVFPTFGAHTQSIVVNPYDAPVPLTTQGNLKFSGSIKFTL